MDKKKDKDYELKKVFPNGDSMVVTLAPGNGFENGDNVKVEYPEYGKAVVTKFTV